jgi:hypothetical protein
MNLYRCITFHFKAERLGYLEQVLAAHHSLGCPSRVEILTNTFNENEQALIQESIASIGLSNAAVVGCKVPHKWLLPWASKLTLKAAHETGQYTHFLYSEDDILVSRENLEYFCTELPHLKKLGLYPGFLRVEWSSSQSRWVASDVNHMYGRIAENAPRLKSSESGAQHSYICPTNAYQAMFLYDQDLFEEHLKSPTFDMKLYGGLENLNDEWGGGVAERAAFALTYYNAPAGFPCRNPLPYSSYFNLIEPCCFIHHIPNNYAEREGYFDVTTLISGGHPNQSSE